MGIETEKAEVQGRLEIENTQAARVSEREAANWRRSGRRCETKSKTNGFGNTTRFNHLKPSL